MCLLPDKLQLCIEKWQEIVKEEYQQQQLNEAFDNLHLCSHSSMTRVHLFTLMQEFLFQQRLLTDYFYLFIFCMYATMTL